MKKRKLRNQPWKNDIDKRRAGLILYNYQIVGSNQNINAKTKKSLSWSWSETTKKLESHFCSICILVIRSMLCLEEKREGKTCQVCKSEYNTVTDMPKSQSCSCCTIFRCAHSTHKNSNDRRQYRNTSWRSIKPF